MPVKQSIPFNNGMFFITFTCHSWLPLIDKVDGYDIVYKWFDHLKGKGHFINGYVIMPNHVHALISFKNTYQSINTIIGNGKRFMAYEIIDRLTNKNEMDLLKILSENVEKSGRAKNKLHEVWEISFDWKECRSPEFIIQKLHLHSSAKYYIENKERYYAITNFMEMEDINLF